jgi:hypothetical protein
MNRMIWIAASMLVVVGLAAGCSGSSTTSKPAATNSGAPKNENKTNVGKGGLENPPPP